LVSSATARCGFRLRIGADAELASRGQTESRHTSLSSTSRTERTAPSHAAIPIRCRKGHLQLSGGKGNFERAARCTKARTLLYRASKLACDRCSLKSRCCPKEPARKIPRDIHEHARDVARSLVGTEAFEQSRHDRKRIEMRFAHLAARSSSTTWPRGAQDEFTLAAIAQNLRRLAKLVTEPPPLVAPHVAPAPAR